MGPHQVVGIVASGQEAEACPLAVADQRQHDLERAARGLDPGAIAVEREDDVIGKAQQAADVSIRDCGSERRHRVVESGLGQLDHVHVAFTDDRPAAPPDRLHGLVQPVDFLSLAKQRCLGRIEVLRFRGVEHPPTEADHGTASVADRKHQAVAKPVVALAFAGEHQASVDQPGVVIGLDRGAQRLPAFGRKSQAEALCGLAGDPAALEIIDRAARRQRALIERGRQVHHLDQARGTRRSGIARHVVGHGQASLLSDLAHRLHIRQAAVVH